LEIGDYVEVVDDDYTLQGKAEPLLKVVDIDRTEMVVTLSGAPAGATGQAPSKHPLLRRWDHQQGDWKAGNLTLSKSDNAAEIVEAKAGDDLWLNLEDGIQIQFQPGTTYRAGDYWLIPARVATGDVEWPKLRDSQGKIALDAKDQPQHLAFHPHGAKNN